MSKHEKLLKRFLSMPVDFTWQELKALLAGFGYAQVKAGKTGGSRVRFDHQAGVPIILHRPHPSPGLKRYQMEQITQLLKNEEFI
jgi:hypothetical protein